MQIVLLKKVKTLGSAGEIKDIARGYAINFLIPQGLALPATAGYIKEAKSRTRKTVAQEKSNLEETKNILPEINGQEIIIKQKANETGGLFASIRRTQISEYIAKKLGKNIDKEYIILEEPIKKIGEYDVRIVVEDREAVLKVKVEEE